MLCFWESADEIFDVGKTVAVVFSGLNWHTAGFGVFFVRLSPSENAIDAEKFFLIFLEIDDLM